MKRSPRALGWIVGAALFARTLAAAGPDFRSNSLAVGLSRNAPAFDFFAVDSLGQGKLGQNPALPDARTVAGLTLDGHTYKLNGKPVWRVAWSGRALTLRSDLIGGVEAPHFVLTFDQKANHATLLGVMKPGERQMNLPCVLHLPDMGTLRITGPGALEYDASRRTKPAFVRIAFPPATAERRHVEYRLEVTSIYPKLPDVESDPSYDGFRRDWLNIFQVNPRVQMLANNAASDPCAFTLFLYSDLAAQTPPLADGLTANDLVRMTLDRYLAGAKGYGQVGYTDPELGPGHLVWKTPWTTTDTLPSFLIAAGNFVASSGDLAWARDNYSKLAAWARDMFAGDKDGDGLIEYPGTGNFGDRPQRVRRPANWWDTINFGHEDAFSNALAYRAATLFADLAGRLGHADDAGYFAAKAAKLRAAYAPAFLNPATGILAGWKSADGRLHDYWFTFVQGMAVTFSLLDDGSDGFQFYENGGATGCWAYYTVKALYRLGRAEEARRIFYPMLAGYARGEFQGFCADGRSRDWRDWRGGCHGYEGLLVDNYHALLAVLDDIKTKR
jgi:hypothetical protein